MSPLPEVTYGSNEPLYNIGAVSRMTGISMATLRAWERRYDFPEAERTSGGHRLYSEHAVMSLRWVKERIDEGMQTAQAINALRHQEHTGNLVMVEQVAATRDGKIEKIIPPYLNVYQEQLISALLAGDMARSDIILGESLALITPEDLMMNMIGPAFDKVGQAWEEGKISVATEHLATNYLRQRLLMWMLSSPPPRNVGPVVLACAPSEWHEGSLLMLGALLRRRRWPIAYLGQAVPLADLAGFVRDLNPSMVVLIAMTETAAAELSEWAHWLPEVAQSGHPIVGYGGRIFVTQPQWRMRMMGLYLGDTLQEGLNIIERVLPQVI